MDELTVDYLSEKPFFSLFFSKNMFSYTKIGDTISVDRRFHDQADVCGDEKQYFRVIFQKGGDTFFWTPF